MRPTNDEWIRRAEELLPTLEDYDPKPEDFDAPMTPFMAMKLAAWRRALAEKEVAEAVSSARSANLSWREIGDALGTSGEAARQRYGRTAA